MRQPAPVPAVFLDRDGTLIHNTEYCSDPRLVRVFPGAVRALQRLKEKGFRLFVITNQSGIGRGFITPDQYRAVEAETLRQLGNDLIEATYFCPDVPGQPSQFRKPAPGMVLQAIREHNLDPARSFFIGDKEIDVECGHNAGVRAVRVRTGFDKMTDWSTAEWVAEDLPAAVELILNASDADR
jgi:D-glycero-D-manno-heptose 1,7-bisphosphate phosphatase